MITALSPTRLLFALLVLLATSLRADTNQALAELLAALVSNGSLKPDQAELIRRVAVEAPRSDGLAPRAATLAAPPATSPGAPESAPPAPAPVFATPKEKGVSRLVVSGMIQPQWDWIETNVAGGPQPAARNTFLMRRMKLAVAGSITEQWTGLVEADFAGASPLEQGYVSYRGLRDTEISFGHTKVPFLKEELLSDAIIKGVERSASHRAFVESPGRGFGAKNMGVHLKGKLADGFNYATAVTNPGAKNFAGTAGNVANGLAYYAQFGLARAAAEGRWETALQAAYLPDLLAAGPITATAAHVYYDGPRLGLLAEYAVGYFARRGGAARQTGFMIEPSFKLTEKAELVLRYASVNSDGLGLAPGSLIRSAPATGEFDQLDSVYLGGNYYFVGNAVRFTFGYEHARATGRLSGPATENEINGLRTRYQFLY